jgi:transcriptional regulator with XRE-family HTH domain
MDASDRFNELCERLKVSRYRIAKEIGVSENTLSYWSRGRTTPTVDVLQKVSRYFGVSITYFFDDTEDIKKYAIYGEFAEHIQIILDRPDIADHVLVAAESSEDDLIIVDGILRMYNDKHKK